jgi:hypothetical protein
MRTVTISGFAAIAVLLTPLLVRAADEKDDLAKVQGLWERRKTEQRIDVDEKIDRVVKDVSGNRETVTYYDKDGKVLRQHRVDFKVERRGDIKVWTFSNKEVTEGADKGQKTAGPISYIYRVTEDAYTEVWGFLPGQEDSPVIVAVYKKLKSRPAAQ